MRSTAFLNCRALGALHIVAFVLAGCHGQDVSPGNIPGTQVGIQGGDMTHIPNDYDPQKVDPTCGGLAAGEYVRLRINQRLLAQLGAGKLVRDADHSKDEVEGTVNVNDPTVPVQQPTRLDMKLESNWFHSDKTKPADQYVILRIKIPKTDPANPKINDINFLTNPDAKNKDDSSWAVKANTKGSDMMCWMSPIKSNTADTFSFVEIHIKPGSVANEIGGINIGLMIGPDASKDGKYIPIYIDPKVHNDGNP